MQARIEQGCLKLKADTDEEKQILRKFYDSFFATKDGLETDFGISDENDETFFLFIRPAPKVN
jgi:hypothetical protein